MAGIIYIQQIKSVSFALMQEQSYALLRWGRNMLEV